MTSLEEECWMRDFNYEEYVIACNRSWATPLSKDLYYSKFRHWNDAQDAKNDPLRAYLLGTWERQQ